MPNATASVPLCVPPRSERVAPWSERPCGQLSNDQPRHADERRCVPDARGRVSMPPGVPHAAIRCAWHAIASRTADCACVPPCSRVAHSPASRRTPVPCAAGAISRRLAELWKVRWRSPAWWSGRRVSPHERGVFLRARTRLPEWKGIFPHACGGARVPVSLSPAWFLPRYSPVVYLLVRHVAGHASEHERA